MVHPLVSVVIPAYNAARRLRPTLESVLAQTYRPIEIVVVDDGSDDGTSTIAASFGPPIRCIRQPNAGAAAARNRGIAASRGTYVALLDADDLWLPRKLEIQVAALQAQPEVGAVQCGTTYVDDTLRTLEIRRPKPGPTTLWDVVRFRNVVALMSTLVIRRTCIDAAGAQEPRFEGKDEWEWGMRIAWRCGLASVPEPLVLHRVFAESMSRNVDSHIAPGLAVLADLYARPDLPADVRRRRRAAYGSFYAMLAGGYFQARRLRPFLLWMSRAIRADPRQTIRMFTLPLRALARARSRAMR